MTMSSDPPKAQLFYDQADALYAQAGALRGGAAIAMRRAHLARRAGDRGTCAAHRDEARQLRSDQARTLLPASSTFTVSSTGLTPETT